MKEGLLVALGFDLGGHGASAWHLGGSLGLGVAEIGVVWAPDMN